MLCCPKCKEILKKEERCFRCVHQHTYDISKRGYIHMRLENRKATGDDKEMVRARALFLAGGYYEILQDTLVRSIYDFCPKVIVDAGCGEGYYTNEIKRRLPDSKMFGFDLSKHAVHEACKERLDIRYVVCSVFHMPLQMACADMIVSVFSPFAIEEVHRVLKKGGIFIKVGPGPKHLFEMKKILYDNVYENSADVVQYEGFELVQEMIVEDCIHIKKKEHLHALFQMTPYYWKSPIAGSERLKKLDELQSRIQFRIELYRKCACIRKI